MKKFRRSRKGKSTLVTTTPGEKKKQENCTPMWEEGKLSPPKRRRGQGKRTQ